MFEFHILEIYGRLIQGKCNRVLSYEKSYENSLIELLSRYRRFSQNKVFMNIFVKNCQNFIKTISEKPIYSWRFELFLSTKKHKLPQLFIRISDTNAFYRGMVVTILPHFNTTKFF